MPLPGGLCFQKLGFSFRAKAPLEKRGKVARTVEGGADSPRRSGESHLQRFRKLWRPWYSKSEHLVKISKCPWYSKSVPTVGGGSPQTLGELGFAFNGQFRVPGAL